MGPQAQLQAARALRGQPQARMAAPQLAPGSKEHREQIRRISGAPVPRPKKGPAAQVPQEQNQPPEQTFGEIGSPIMEVRTGGKAEQGIHGLQRPRLGLDGWNGPRGAGRPPQAHPR